MSEDHLYATTFAEARPRPKKRISLVREAARNAALFGLNILSQRREPSFLRCLYCHYVFDDQKKRFRSVLESLQRIGTFVDTDTCVSMLTGETDIDGKYFHLSFDDGFRNIYLNAAPVLKEFDIPALILVPTAMIEADYRASKEFTVGRLEYSGALEMMKWDDLRQLRSSGFDIGSHTRTHAKLSEFSADESLLRREIDGSKLELEDRLGVECKYISWPYGRRGDVDDVSLRCIKRAGYAACFGAFRGSVYPLSRMDRFCIPRHHFEAQWPLSHISYFARGGMEN